MSSDFKVETSSTGFIQSVKGLVSSVGALLDPRTPVGPISIAPTLKSSANFELFKFFVYQKIDPLQQRTEIAIKA
ncbi:MAG: hypothetical protein K1060chlam2_01234, partial [Chlamydiae bacterium]|nr:hypothetical protein [Chlamydiota bacterium]